MMPVPSYQLIPFLAWLQRRGIRVSVERMEFEQLQRLALRFLQSGGHLPLDGLEGLMAIFQACPAICETSVKDQMQHFAGCGQCLEMISEHRMGSRFQGETWPLPALFGDRDDGEVGLHPLLTGFVTWARGSRVEARLHREAHRPRREVHEPDHSFRRIIHMVGDDLLEEFGRYVTQLGERDPRLIEDFERWRSREERRRAPMRPHGSRARVDNNTHPIGPNESLDQAARRLAESVRVALEHGFYDDRIAEEPQFAKFMALTMESPENLAQALDFMGWLQRREPELSLPGSIPSGEIEGLALQFCEDRGYPNGRSFAREARKWLSGSGSERILSRIARFLGLDRRARMPDGRPNPHNLLDRYGAVRFHGLFLFLSSGDFPGFLESHWRDLHHLTGEVLDIYFSQSDLRDRTSGYEIANELRSIEINVDALPALLLWEDELEAATTIPLQELGHTEVVEVVKAVVQAICNDASLAEATRRGAERSRELRKAGKPGIVVQTGASLVINNGGVVGKRYENIGGVVGAMGDRNVVHDNVFLQDAKKVLSEITLSADDGAMIAKLAEGLATAQLEQLQLTERMEGARQLAAVAEAATKGRQPAKPVAEWRMWLKGLGDRAEPVLSMLANVAAVATPIAKLLGLPV